jgi:hypothetical protein
MIVIHTPMKCQNGHPNRLVVHFEGGEIVKTFYLYDLCKCPKGDFSEGYAPAGDDVIHSITSRWNWDKAK